MRRPLVPGLTAATIRASKKAPFSAYVTTSMGSSDRPVRVWMPHDRWDALPAPRLQLVASTPARAIFVADLSVSRLRLQREQHVPGWCVLLLRRHVREPHELPPEERSAFFDDMVRVGRALERVYGAQKIKYSILRNIVPHLHAHIQPRYHGETLHNIADLGAAAVPKRPQLPGRLQTTSV